MPVLCFAGRYLSAEAFCWEGFCERLFPAEGFVCGGISPQSRIYMINHPSTGYGKKKKKIRMNQNGKHVAAMMKIGEWQCVVELLALFAYPSFPFSANRIGNKNLH